MHVSFSDKGSANEKYPINLEREALAEHTEQRHPTNQELMEKIRVDGVYGDEQDLVELAVFLYINICVHYLEKGGRTAYLQYRGKFSANTVQSTYTISPLHYNWLQ